MSALGQAQHSIGAAEVGVSQAVGTTASLELLLLLRQRGADVLDTEAEGPLLSHAAVCRLCIDCRDASIE